MTTHFFVKHGDALVLEVKAAKSMPVSEVIQNLQEAIDCLNGDIRECDYCGTTCHKNTGYICPTCGTDSNAQS